MAKPRIGLLGGSFDPVHVTHVHLALAAQKQLALQQVQLLPAAKPWQKQQLGATAEQRLAMLELAVAPYPHLTVNSTEIDRGGITYTYDTVSQLPSHYHYFWILGSDQLQNFHTWQRWQDIVNHVELAVAQRPGSALTPAPVLNDYLKSQQKSLHIIDFDPNPISATLIRQRLQQHQSVAHLVPPAVAHYIEQHSLYQL